MSSLKWGPHVPRGPGPHPAMHGPGATNHFTPPIRLWHSRTVKDKWPCETGPGGGVGGDGGAKWLLHVWIGCYFASRQGYKTLLQLFGSLAIALLTAVQPWGLGFARWCHPGELSPRAALSYYAASFSGQKVYKSRETVLSRGCSEGCAVSPSGFQGA